MNISFKPLASLLVLSALSFASFGQNNGPVNRIGKVSNVTINGQQVNITTDENEHVQVQVYSPSVVHVRMDKKPLGENFSYAVVGKPKQTKANITQDNDAITITTDSLVTRISKNPFAIAFLTKDGKVINRDEEGLTTSWIGEEVTTYKEMQEGERFIGLGEKTGGLDRRGSGYTNWNTDAYGYSTGQDPLYATIPVYIGIHSGLNYGIFFDNSYQSDFNFGASNDRFSSFGAQGGEMDYYFIYHDQLEDIITSYTDITGRMDLPPLWSLGYQQNRYSYYPETEVMRIAQTLREKKIPADGITLDIHYMDAYKLFTWDDSRFPNPAAMNKKLEEMGFKTTVIVDPGIKVEKGYGAYERGLKDDIFLKYPDGVNYSGQVWPGWTHFPDFTSEKGREWWKKELKYFAETGVDGFWNDMNEIATWGQKMPNNVLFQYDGHLTSHKEGRNVYGLEMARASYEGARQHLPKQRPFLLSRAGFAGSQRYTALWTGDNRSEDSHMLLGIRLLNSMGVSGIPFSAMDIGGFTGNPSIGLYARWIQLGAFTPYFRNHTGVNSKSSEPWAYGEEVTEIARNFINLRYKLLPYIYSNFYLAAETGLPLMRTLAIDYTHDPKVYNGEFDTQYQFGESFLIMPFESGKNYGKVYFPQGKWYNLYTGEVETGNREEIIPISYNKLPIYVKESSIIPMQSLVQSTSEKPTDTLTVHIYKGDVNNSFVYYEDDGASYDYQNGQYYKRTINYDARRKAITFDKVEGSYNSNFKNIKVMLHGFDAKAKLKLNGKNQKAQQDFASFIDPISRFDPQGSANPKEGYNVQSFVIKNDKDKITLSY
ncbi:glycoside hydrolase family 31 protein [Pontibacter akesuensis]|uniref:Alpha-glucosidase n=1 Tax=Pontibacter akesuensis TaxID=388950 RepID=A0A1I7GSC0_9BACT|nr:TIM-barrel domain-containing protein [Pontibacter akesuensis]GHA55315.1 alpha-glucosidase [Pontibacter akesuensis]SFU51348.1 alpha-glucosidase [Pontibacter akesuensis]